MPEIAWIMAPTTSLSSVTWPSISFARSRPRAPCASRSSGRDGRTHISPKSSPKSEMRLPWLLSGSGVMGSGLVVNRPREAESLGVGPDRAVDPLVALGAEESENHGGPDQVDDPARRGEVL